ncbi:MAG: hypothetical protein CVU46_18440, partial [Chloroflexi bacterium HGW-Chloroflexi-8]
MTKVSSKNGTLEFGPGFPTMLINETLYVVNKPESVIEPISKGNFETFLELARWGQVMGTDMTALLITHPEINEVEILPRLARAIHEETGSPVGLDTRNPEAIEAALAELKPYRSIIWTVTAEQKVLDELLPIAKKYDAVVSGMPMGRNSINVPMTVEERLSEANTIIDACKAYDIPVENIVIDAVCM